jgi:hypothetical protein
LVAEAILIIGLSHDGPATVANGGGARNTWTLK